MPTRDRYKKLFAVASQVFGRDAANEELHKMVREKFRAESLKLCSNSQIDEIIGELQRANAVTSTNPLLSVAQRKKIIRLAYVLRWSNAGIRSYLASEFGKRDYNLLTFSEANRCIKRLSMIVRGKSNS